MQLRAFGRGYPARESLSSTGSSLSSMVIQSTYVGRTDLLVTWPQGGRRRANLGGEIKTDLQRREEMIGPNDLHIAAHARSEALTLVTNNQREFAPVDGLRTARWV